MRHRKAAERRDRDDQSDVQGRQIQVRKLCTFTRDFGRVLKTGIDNSPNLHRLGIVRVHPGTKCVRGESYFCESGTR